MDVQLQRQKMIKNFTIKHCCTELNLQHDWFKMRQLCYMFATDWVIMKSICLLYDNGFILLNPARFRRMMYGFWSRNDNSKITYRNFSKIIKKLNKDFKVKNLIDVFGISGLAYGVSILKSSRK